MDISPLMGNYLVPTCALQPGRLLVAEECAVRRPGKEQGDTPVCLSCYFPAYYTPLVLLRFAARRPVRQGTTLYSVSGAGCAGPVPRIPRL